MYGYVPVYNREDKNTCGSSRMNRPANDVLSVLSCHVETVVQLFRKTPDAHIDLKIDMDELDLTAAEAKATYQEIKDYILKKHGVKVSALYIAQTKQKHGIIERDCYNKPKGEQEKAPHCPPEKEHLIEEALRHFKMI